MREAETKASVTSTGFRGFRLWDLEFRGTAFTRCVGAMKGMYRGYIGICTDIGGHLRMYADAWLKAFRGLGAREPGKAFMGIMQGGIDVVSGDGFQGQGLVV